MKTEMRNVFSSIRTEFIYRSLDKMRSVDFTKENFNIPESNYPEGTKSVEDWKKQSECTVKEKGKDQD